MENKKITNFMDILDKSVSPYHFVFEAIDLLKKEGFKELILGENFKIEENGKYFINVFDSSVFAFVIGNNIDEKVQLRMAAGHTDWPTFKLKPNPEIKKEKYGLINVEKYGGPIFSTWMDRPLGLSGKVCAVNKDDYFNPKTVFIDTKRPVATIPNLAIHMNREVNDGVKINPQTNMLPILKMIKEKMEREDFLIELIEKETGFKKEEILDFELYLYNMDKPQLVGIDEEFISSPRIDNITSCDACLNGIITNSREVEKNPKLNENKINIITLYDNEEIGSNTKQGAKSSITERVLEKIFLNLGFKREAFLNAVINGTLISMDVAHAIHPNYTDKCDITNKNTLNDGISLKVSAAQSYATDSRAISIIEGICKKENIKYQKYLNRSDIKGGSTLGALSSSLLSMKTVDLGVAILAMHSSRELMGKEDQLQLQKLAESFFRL